MTRPHTAAPTFVATWNTAQTGTARMRVGDGRQLRRLLESVALEALFADTVCEVDLLAGWTVPGFPLLVQFLVGHPTDTYVIVHEDLGAVSARIRGDEAVPVPWRHERPRGADVIDAEVATVPVALLAEILHGVCLTGEVPGYVEWVEMPMD